MRCLLSEAIVLLPSSLRHEANIQALCWMLNPVTQMCPGTVGAEQGPPASAGSRAGKRCCIPSAQTQPAGEVRDAQARQTPTALKLHPETQH